MSIKSRCLCGERNAKPLFSTDGYLIVQCFACHQVRTDYPEGKAQKSAYDKTDIGIYIEKESDFRRLFGRIIRFVQRFIRRGILIDIGAGVGLLVREAKRAGFEAYGFEPSKPAVRAARKHFGVILQAKKFLPKHIAHPVDAVILNHVLEHIDDPKKLMLDISTILRPRGYLFVGVPNFGNIIAILKQSRWQSLIPLQHRWHFTYRTLDWLVVPHGFERVASISDNHDRNMHPWWKQPVYHLHDIVTSVMGMGEAIFVVYKRL